MNTSASSISNRKGFDSVNNEPLANIKSFEIPKDLINLTAAKTEDAALQQLDKYVQCCIADCRKKLIDRPESEDIHANANLYFAAFEKKLEESCQDAEKSSRDLRLIRDLVKSILPSWKQMFNSLAGDIQALRKKN